MPKGKKESPYKSKKDPSSITSVRKRTTNRSISTMPKGKKEPILITAVRQRYIDQIGRLISQNKNNDAFINEADADGYTPLHWCADQYDEAGKTIAEKLISAGANINMQDKYYKFTPLHWAIDYVNTNIAYLLLEHKDKLNLAIPGKHGWTPLHIAVGRKKNQIIEALLENGAEPDIQDKEGYTILHWYVDCCRDIEIPNFLIEKITDFNAKDKAGFIALNWAIFYNNNINTIKKLISKSDLNFLNIDGEAPLHQALREKKFTIVNTLIEEGIKFNIDLNIQDKDGLTPLHWAIDLNQIDIIKLLIKNGADLNVQDKYGFTPLHKAINENKIDIANLLIEQDNIDLTLKDKEGYNAFHLVLDIENENDAISIIQNLIKKAADLINKQDNEGYSVLHWAAEKGLNKVTEFLIKLNNINLNLQSKKGYTPFLIAVNAGNLDTVKILLKEKVDINLANKKNNTPLHLAAKKNYINIAKILIEKGANRNIKNKDGKTPLDLTSNQIMINVLNQKVTQQTCDKSIGSASTKNIELDTQSKIKKRKTGNSQFQQSTSSQTSNSTDEDATSRVNTTNHQHIPSNIINESIPAILSHSRLSSSFKQSGTLNR